MGTRVTRRAVPIGLLALTLIGCRSQSSSRPGDRLAVGPDQAALASVRPDYILAAVEAAGGLPTWMQCRQLDFAGIVTAYRPDGGYYLTEHAFAIYPWSEAVTISAREPQSAFVWQAVGDRFERREGDASLDVSPLAGAYQDYATAVLQIVTAPARVLERRAQLSRRPLPLQIRGIEYDAIDAQFAARQAAEGKRQAPAAEFFWTNATYYQNHRNSRIEMVWLGNPVRRAFLVVRGYDYETASSDGPLIPTQIEIFRSDAEGRIGTRLVKIDLAP